MTALHICRDHNFVVNSRKVFEHYYPGKNIFIAHSLTGKLKMIKDPQGFEIFNLYEKDSYARVEKICKENNVDRIALHALVDYMPGLLKYLKSVGKFKIYWIFWGYELYETIGYEKGYKLIDEKPSIFRKETLYTPNWFSKIIRKATHNYRPAAFQKIFPMIDYFCFWNKADYDLFKKYYDLPVDYKYFAYSANFNSADLPEMPELVERPSTKILINHQASLFGNHLTIFDKLHEIDVMNRYEKVVPLSYGSAPIRSRVLKTGYKLFGEKFHPVVDFMPAEEYSRLLKSIDVAIFGQRRQEASGNIIELLRNGVKVFLRNDNNLIKYYRDKGYLIYSVEDDMTGPEALNPLSIGQKRRNRECYLRNRVCYDDFMPDFFRD